MTSLTVGPCCQAPHGLNRPRLLVPLGTERHVDGAGSGSHCSIGHVKRVVAALAGILGIAWLRRRTTTPAPAAVDPAADLRAKLAQAREVEDDREQFEAGETPVDEAPDVADRRRDVHDRARAAIDDLSSDD